MKKNLLDYNKILILLMVFIFLNITPACAIQMQIAPEQSKISNIRINSNIKIAENCSNTLPNNTTNKCNALQIQKTFKKVLNNKNGTYKLGNKIVKNTKAIINFKVDGSLNTASNTEQVKKDRIDQANKLHPNVKAKLDNATITLKVIDVKYDEVKKNYVAVSATETELNDDLKNYITSTKKPGEYEELQKQYELIHTNKFNLHSNLNNLETQRKKLKMQIIYLNKCLNALEQIQSFDKKTSNENVNPIINNYNENINALKKLDKTQNTGINSFTTPNNKSSYDNQIMDHEISTNEQLNNNLNTVNNRPQEPMMDAMLYTSITGGIPGFIGGIAFKGARLITNNRVILITNTKMNIATYKKKKMLIAEQEAAEQRAEELYDAKNARLLEQQASDARLSAMAEKIKEAKAALARLKQTPSSNSVLALETETVKETTTVVDIASSSGTKTEVLSEVVSSSPMRTEVLAEVAPLSAVETEVLTEVATSSAMRTEVLAEVAPLSAVETEVLANVASSSGTGPVTSLTENVASSGYGGILEVITDTNGRI